jgi:cytidylate kinase
MESTPMTTIKQSGNMTELLERQGSLQEIRRRLARERGEARHARVGGLDQGPWITLSKSLGADWEGMARRLAKELGWETYDREILETVSRESHVREALLSSLDEREVGWIEETLARFAAPDRPAHQAYLDQMARVILALGHHGRAILVGRGANWLLDPGCGLRVRLVAPLPARIARVAKAERLSPAEARERIRHDDESRARFIHQVYQQDINDPAGYDMILNLGSLTQDAAAECVLAALRGKLGRALAGR